MKNKRTRVVAYLGMLSLLASLILGLMGYTTTSKEIVNVKNQLLRNHVENNINLSMKYIYNAYGTLTVGDQTLLDKNGHSIEGRFGVVDAVLEDLGDKSTIFVKVGDDFKRISTNLTSDDDSRAIGTYLGKDHNAYGTVMQGKLYVGEADIFGDRYFTAYQPIKDSNENVIGMLFVGIDTKTLDNIREVHDDRLDTINILIIILRAISLGSLIILASNTAKSQDHKWVGH